jgi:LuxR family maltose regulon positive regulatory protein
LIRAKPRCARHEVVQQLVLARATAARDPDAAAASAAAAVQTAAEHGMLQTVASDGTDVLDLIELAAWRAPETWMERLRHLLVPAWQSSPTGPVEPLTEREREVMRLLPSRLTLREISAHMHVSQNTLKFHLRAIYRKLGVGSRAEAVDVARELRLLPGG